MSLRFRLQLVRFLSEYKFSNFNSYFQKNISDIYFIENNSSALFTLKNFVRNYTFIEYCLSKLLTKKKSLPVFIEKVLLLGIFQIFFQPNIPDYAIVNESVELSVRNNYKGLKNLVNGVLRNCLRNKDILLLDINSKKDKIDLFALKYSFKKWMLKRWLNEYGYDEVEKILKYFNTDDFSQAVLKFKNGHKNFSNTNIIYNAGKYNENIIYIKNMRIFLDLFKDKSNYLILDETSLLPSYFYNDIIFNTGNILEIGSFPGTKTVLINKFADISKYDLYLIDSAENKHQKFKYNTDKYNIKYKKLYIDNFIDKKFSISFDAVFLDAPCSALGTIKKNPEIKFNRSEKDIINASKLQKKMINKSLDLLSKNGILVYSVCSFEPEETYLLIRDILFERKDVVIDNYNNIPEKYKDVLLKKSGFLSVPFKTGLSGFFVTKLRKII